MYTVVGINAPVPASAKVFSDPVGETIEPKGQPDIIPTEPVRSRYLLVVPEVSVGIAGKSQFLINIPLTPDPPVITGTSTLAAGLEKILSSSTISCGTEPEVPATTKSPTFL